MLVKSLYYGLNNFMRSAYSYCEPLRCICAIMQVKFICRSKCLVNEKHRNNSSYTYWEMCEISFVIWLHGVKMFLILCETLSLKMLKTHVRHVSKKGSPSKATYIPMQAAKFCQSRVGMCSLCYWCHMSISMISVVCQKLWNVKKKQFYYCVIFFK